MDLLIGNNAYPRVDFRGKLRPSATIGWWRWRRGMTATFGAVTFAHELEVLVAGTVTSVGHLSLGFALRSLSGRYLLVRLALHLMCDQSGALSLSMNYCVQYTRLNPFRLSEQHFF